MNFFINAKIATGSEPTVVFINPGKTGEVFWDMVSDFMQQAGQQLNIDLTIYIIGFRHFTYRFKRKSFFYTKKAWV